MLQVSGPHQQVPTTHSFPPRNWVVYGWSRTGGRLAPRDRVAVLRAVRAVGCSAPVGARRGRLYSRCVAQRPHSAWSVPPSQRVTPSHSESDAERKVRPALSSWSATRRVGIRLHGSWCAMELPGTSQHAARVLHGGWCAMDGLNNTRHLCCHAAGATLLNHSAYLGSNLGQAEACT